MTDVSGPSLKERCEKAQAEALVFAVRNAGPRDWPEDFSHDNGRYLNTCCGCNHIFTGHKRRNECKVCAHGETTGNQVST